MTLRGASYNQDTATLDLTKVRLSVAQFVALLLLFGGMIATQSVALWRLGELSEQVRETRVVVHQLELANARK